MKITNHVTDKISKNISNINELDNVAQVSNYSTLDKSIDKLIITDVFDGISSTTLISKSSKKT